MTTAENCAQGQKDEKEVVEAWMDKAGHEENMKNKEYDEMGCSKNGPFWTQVLGKSKK